jgi:hypothetical protein
MATAVSAGPLAGVKVVEFGGIGPLPFCGMLLADMGADIVRIQPPSGDPWPNPVTTRGKICVSLDLKNREVVADCLDLLSDSDVLIEGFRPGVMERLGLGPDVVMRSNPRLMYGRMTGWGQDGPLAKYAGYDIDYIALSRVLAAMRPAPIVLGRLYLVPVLSDFLQAYPDIDSRLTLADRLVNLTEEGVDTALRVGDLPDSALVATRIGTIHRVFAACPADLVKHNCIGVQGLTGPSFWSLAGDAEVPTRYRLIVNSTDAACEAAKAGLGIISVFSHHVVSSFQDRTLVPILPDFKRTTLPLSLARGSGGYLPIKLRAFLDFVTPRLKMRFSVAREDYLVITEKTDLATRV